MQNIDYLFYLHGKIINVKKNHESDLVDLFIYYNNLHLPIITILGDFEPFAKSLTVITHLSKVCKFLIQYDQYQKSRNVPI
jgi:hypothetical protein